MYIQSSANVNLWTSLPVVWNRNEGECRVADVTGHIKYGGEWVQKGEYKKASHSWAAPYG